MIITDHRLRQAIYAPVLALAMILMFARLLLLAKVLDVLSFAELSATLIVSGLVGMLASLGLFLDLQRKLPGYLVLGQRRAAATHIWQSILGTLAVGLIGLIAAASKISFGGITSDVIAIGIIHGVSQQLFLVVTTESRSNNEPLRFSMQSLFRSIGLVIFAVAAAYMLNSAKAAIFAEIAVTLVATLVISLQIFRRFSIDPLTAARLAIRSLFRVDWKPIGILLLLSLTTACSINMDRWLSSAYLTKIEFAQYSFAWITLTAAFAVQSLTNASIFPMIVRRSVLKGARPAFRLSAFVTFGMLALFMIAIVPSVYFADLAIGRLYPKYSNSTLLIPILAIAAAFRISDFWSSFLVIQGRESISLAVNISVNAAAIVLWAATKFGTESTALSLAYLAAFSAIGTFMLSFICSYNHCRIVHD